MTNKESHRPLGVAATRRALGACRTGATAIALGAMMVAGGAVAQESDVCEGVGDLACVNGYEVRLLSYVSPDEDNNSVWEYEVCNQVNTETCIPSSTGGGLSHVDIFSPDLFSDCPNIVGSFGDVVVTIEQSGGFDSALLGCETKNDRDPSCTNITVGDNDDTDLVMKCNVDDGDLDPGECVEITLTIHGVEVPNGPANVVTKIGGGTGSCEEQSILGPACVSCDDNGDEDACLTRTPGFWGNRPDITTDFLPIEVCGETLTTVELGEDETCESVTEALCVSPGTESRSNQSYAQLVRQLAAAQLNLAATEALDGFCDPTAKDRITDARIAECEALCGANQGAISRSGCIDDLAAFNESDDSIDLTDTVFATPGPAQPALCQSARGDGIVIGKGDCAP